MAGAALAGTALAAVSPGRVLGWKPVQAGRYVIRNDDFGAGIFLSGNGGEPGFTVHGNAKRDWTAFPNIFYGCEWGICTRRSGLPAVVSRTNPVSTWFTHRAPGVYGTAYDIWLTRHRQISGPYDSEIMIWLNHPGVHVSRAWPRVGIDGARWSVMSWRASQRGHRWNYLAFVRVRQVTSARSLRVAPFFRYAERRRKIGSRWYLDAIEAGFELCRGGNGLATTWFWGRR